MNTNKRNTGNKELKTTWLADTYKDGQKSCKYKNGKGRSMSDHSRAPDKKLSAYLYKWNVFSRTFKECGLVLRQFTTGGNVIKDCANQINCNLFLVCNQIICKTKS